MVMDLNEIAQGNMESHSLWKTLKFQRRFKIIFDIHVIKS